MMRRTENFSSNFSPQFSVQHKSSVSNANVIDVDVGQDNFKSDERTCLFLALFNGAMSQLLKSLRKDQCRSVSSRYPPHTENIHWSLFAIWWCFLSAAYVGLLVPLTSAFTLFALKYWVKPRKASKCGMSTTALQALMNWTIWMATYTSFYRLSTPDKQRHNARYWKM